MRIVILFLLVWIAIGAQPLSLSSQERHLLDTHPMRCISTGTWPPFTVELKGKLTGIGIENWRKITQKLNIPFDCTRADNWTEVLRAIRNRTRDLTVATQQTEERMQYAVFSEPYARYPYVAVTKKNTRFSFDTDQTIVVGRDYSVARILRLYYPKLHVEEVDSIEAVLQMVRDGHAYAAVDVLPVMAYFLDKKPFASLGIASRFPESFSFRIMLRKDYAPVVPLINKAIHAILNEEEQEEIIRKWETIKKENAIDPRYVYGGLALFVVALFILFYVVRSLKKQIRTKEEDIRYFEKKASFDSLTLVYNRDMLDTLLAQQIAIADRYRKRMSVIFFDIDDFKAINDTYGHNAGDDALIELTRLVSSSLKGSEIFGRWGGDEFMIILPESDQAEANALAEALAGLIREHTFTAVEHLSCSFGVATYQFGDTPKELLHRADKKLYEAKQNKDDKES